MPPLSDELLAHAGWLRRLAQSLVGAGGGADDLVQETWVAALRHPPRTDLPLRPWLAQVLRNLVRMRRRHGGVQAAKRDEIERSERERTAPSSPEALLGRLESERLLARLVAELDEPYRQTVLLRYFEGRSSADIARLLGIPAATVRWRLKTGIARLRMALDHAHQGDRKKWQLALLPLALTAPPAPPAPAAGLLKGIWLMTRTQKAVAAGAAVLVLLAALLLVVGRDGSPSRPSGGGAPNAGVTAPPAAPAVPPIEKAAAPAASPRTAVSLVPGAGAKVVHEPALENGAFGGRVLNWSTGDGVANAQVSFAGEGGATLTAGTDAAGRFALEPPAAGRYVLAVASAQGFLPYAPEWGHSPVAVIARPGLRITDVTLFLIPAVEYLGVVEDGKGRKVAGATVRLLEASVGEQAMSPLADRFVTDANGEFKFNAPDHSLLEARHPAHGVGRARMSDATSVSHRLTIKLAARPGDAALGALAVTGRVIDDKGAPIPAALVRASHVASDDPHPRAEARAGDDGKFELTGLDEGLHDVWVVCAGCASAHARVPAGADVTLKVEPGGAIVGRVMSADDGQPVPAFSVLVSRPRGVAETVVDESTVVDAEGRFEVHGLEPGEYKVRATAHGHAPSPPVAATVGAEDPVEVALRLTRGATIHGRVVERGSGKPLGWARVTVEGGVGDGSSAVPLSVSAVTDDDGQFELPGVPPGMRSVVAAAFGHHLSMVSGLRVAEGARLGPLRFELGATRPGEEPKLELFGIGVQLRADGDALVVDGVVEGGGGQLAGLLPGDAIVKVDGELVTDLGFQDAIQRIRGPAGSRVLLAVRRPNPGGTVTQLIAERRPIQY